MSVIFDFPRGIVPCGMCCLSWRRNQRSWAKSASISCLHLVWMVNSFCSSSDKPNDLLDCSTSHGQRPGRASSPLSRKYRTNGKRLLLRQENWLVLKKSWTPSYTLEDLCFVVITSHHKQYKLLGDETYAFFALLSVDRGGPLTPNTYRLQLGATCLTLRVENTLSNIVRM